MIRRKGTSRRSPEIPTASVADIAFLLIIFFILATSLIVTKGFVAEMPKGEKTQDKQEKTATVVVRDGEIRFNDQAMGLDGLREKLAEMDLPNQTGNEKIILLEQTGEDPWQRFYEVWAAIQAAGGEVVIVVEESEKPAP